MCEDLAMAPKYGPPSTWGVMTVSARCAAPSPSVGGKNRSSSLVRAAGSWSRRAASEESLVAGPGRFDPTVSRRSARSASTAAGAARRPRPGCWRRPWASATRRSRRARRASPWRSSGRSPVSPPRRRGRAAPKNETCRRAWPGLLPGPDDVRPIRGRRPARDQGGLRLGRPVVPAPGSEPLSVRPRLRTRHDRRARKLPLTGRN